MKVGDLKCEVCGQGPAQGVTLFRVGPKGQPTTHWRCEPDLATAPDPELAQTVATIEALGQTKQ